MRFTYSCLFSLLFCLHLYSQNCTLAGYLDLGVQNSPVLKDLSNQILSNRYDSLIARATCLPQVNFNGYMVYAPTVNGWGYSDVITNGQSLIGTVNVSQQIFNNKTREANLEKIGLESGSLVNARKISVNELKRTITAQYLATFSALAERKVQEEVLANMVNEASVLKSWAEQGVGRQTDYLSLQVEMMTVKRNIGDLDLQYRKEFFNLNLICGVTDTTFCNLNLPVIQDTLTNQTENLLIFKRFLTDSLLINNEKQLLDRKYQPALSWFADGGLINNEPRNLYQNFGLSFGLSMTLPVFDGNQRKINYNKIRMHEETRKYYLDNLRVRYQTQVSQLKDELKNTRLLMKENEKQVALLHELIAANLALVNTGSASITAYILSLQNLIEAKYAGLRYQIRVQYVINELNFWRQ